MSSCHSRSYTLMELNKNTPWFPLVHLSCYHKNRDRTPAADSKSRHNGKHRDRLHPGTFRRATLAGWYHRQCSNQNWRARLCQAGFLRNPASNHILLKSGG